MAKKKTYKPKSPTYRSGGKTKRSYKDKKFKKGDKRRHDWWSTLVGEVTGPIADLFGIGSLQDTLDTWMLDAQNQQTYAGNIATGLAGQLGPGPGPSQILTDYRDEIGLSRPKKTSTAFVENIGDTIKQQTTDITEDIGRTGKFAGIKDVLGAGDTAAITAEKEGAAMDERYQQALTDIEKTELSTETGIVQALGGQEFGGEQAVYDLLGDLTQSAAESGGEMEGQIMSGIFDLEQQEAEAWGDIFSTVIEGVIDVFDLTSDKKLKKNIETVGESEEGVPVSEFEYKKDKDAPEGPGRYRGVIAQDLIGTKHEDAITKKDKNTLGVDYSQLDIQFQKIEEDARMRAKKGAKVSNPEEEVEYNEEGGDKGMLPAGEADVTPGEFSHEENPIDIVQKRPGGDDEKIGEMTGGEAIMPPKDIIEFEEMIEEGDKNAVFNKLKELFSRWDEKASEHEEKRKARDAVRAMGGAKMHYKPKSRINYR